MMNFKERRDTILSQFEKAKSDLQILNNDIDNEINKNKENIQSLLQKNEELKSLKTTNKSSIKKFENFLNG